MKRRRTVLGRVSAAAVLTLALAVAVPSSSRASWSTTASPAPPSVSAAMVPMPTGVGCSSSGILLFRKATVSWTAVSGATSYNVVISNADGSVSGQTTTTGTSIDLTGTVLNNLLGGLIAVLFGSGNATVRVQAVHSSGWASAPSAESVLIGRSGLLIDGLLGGVECK